MPAAPGQAAPHEEPLPLPPNLDSAVSRGLLFLVKQQEADGSFKAESPKVATAGLSLLAMLASGETPDLGRYGLTVRNAADFLLAEQATDGYFGAGGRGMYAHAIATLALAEDYGVESGRERRLRIHSALVGAVGVILNAQNTTKSDPAYAGGWRYERNSPDSDLSLSGWNTLALRAAKDVGIEVPDPALHKAAEFVLRCYNKNDKGFAYQPGGGPQPGDTGIGILCLYMLEASDGARKEIDESVKYLAEHPIEENAPFYYYAHYYTVQASFQHGSEAWAKTGLPAIERLIKSQDADGGWPQSKSGQEPGRVYATAMALGALTVPYRLLPVYQR